jgi:hypothetical protein
MAAGACAILAEGPDLSVPDGRSEPGRMRWSDVQLQYFASLGIAQGAAPKNSQVPEVTKAVVDFLTSAPPSTWQAMMARRR